MSYPAFISQFYAAATDTVQAGAGSIQALPRTYYYFFLSPVHSAANGCSLLYQLGVSAGISNGATWSFVLDSNFKIKVTHNSGGAVNLTMGRGLAWNLGFPLAFSTIYPPDPSQTVTVSVPAGAGGYTAPFRSVYYWCPERLVSMTGPELFDPMTSIGIPSRAGAATRSPDGTASYITNGIQYDAQFVFNRVEGLYRARAPDPNVTNVHEREDYETWWQYGPRLGRRFLFWRDKSRLIGLDWILGLGGTTPSFKFYVEYNPSAEMSARPQITAPYAPNLVFHDITISGWTTERGDAAYG
jgi:hypothetical protein